MLTALLMSLTTQTTAMPADAAHDEAAAPVIASPTLSPAVARETSAVVARVAPCDAPLTILPQANRDCPESGPRRVAVRVARVGVETLLGAGLGAGLGVAGAYAGLNVDLMGGHEAGAGLSVGLALGYALGVAPGVWLAGYAMGGDGSFGWTLVGSALGTGLSAGLLAINDKPPMVAVAALLPLSTAILGYELSSHLRRAKPAERPDPEAFLLVPTFGPTSLGVAGRF